MPHITPSARVRFAIRCAAFALLLSRPYVSGWREWSDKWLSNSDRTVKSARRAIAYADAVNVGIVDVDVAHKAAIAAIRAAITNASADCVANPDTAFKAADAAFWASKTIAKTTTTPTKSVIRAFSEFAVSALRVEPHTGKGEETKGKTNE